MACWCKGKQSLLWLPWKQVRCRTGYQLCRFCQNRCPPISYRLFWGWMVSLSDHPVSSLRTFCPFLNCNGIYETLFPCVAYSNPLMWSPSHFKNQTAEDNLCVLKIIPLFSYVSLNSCLPWIRHMNFSHITPFFSSTCFILFHSNSHQFHLPQNNTTVPHVSHPCPSTHSVGVPVQHCLGGCAAPILITLGEHTCENRCPPGLACCSSLGWSVCVWLATTPLPPSPSFS